MSPPILALPRYGKKYTLDMDACSYQVDSDVLQHQQSGDRLLIGHWSCAVTDAEKYYANTEKECLAVVWSILTLRPYLYENTFDLRTDHEALRWVLNLAEAPASALESPPSRGRCSAMHHRVANEGVNLAV